MPHPRDRAERRAQRHKYIDRRRDRVPDESLPLPVRLWQLHTAEGQRLSVFHRQRTTSTSTFSEPPTPKRVRVQHWCHMTTRLFWRRTPTGNFEPNVVLAEPCSCSMVTPSWGSPLAKAGRVWRVVKEYTPEHREFATGSLSKNRCSGWNPGRQDKNWKLISGHTYKVWRARKLAREYPRRLEHEWEVGYTSEAPSHTSCVFRYS